MLVSNPSRQTPVTGSIQNEVQQLNEQIAGWQKKRKVFDDLIGDIENTLCRRQTCLVENRNTTQACPSSCDLAIVPPPNRDLRARLIQPILLLGPSADVHAVRIQVENVSNDRIMSNLIVHVSCPTDCAGIASISDTPCSRCVLMDVGIDTNVTWPDVQQLGVGRSCLAVVLLPKQMQVLAAQTVGLPLIFTWHSSPSTDESHVTPNSAHLLTLSEAAFKVSARHDTANIIRVPTLSPSIDASVLACFQAAQLAHCDRLTFSMDSIINLNITQLLTDSNAFLWSPAIEIEGARTSSTSIHRCDNDQMQGVWISVTCDEQTEYVRTVHVYAWFVDYSAKVTCGWSLTS